jgi:hypothetical protein
MTAKQWKYMGLMVMLSLLLVPLFYDALKGLAAYLGIPV